MYGVWTLRSLLFSPSIEGDVSTPHISTNNVSLHAGIDFPTQQELLAYRASGTTKRLEDINRAVGRHVGVSFLGYNDVDNLSKGIGIPRSQLCLSCTTGDYSCLKCEPRSKTREEMKG